MRTTELLRGAGLRSTNARRVVLEALLRAGCPLSHPDLTAQAEVGGLDRVTLYRTLGKLEEAGLLHRVQGVDGVWRFRAHSQDTQGCAGNHPHFLCRRCGRMQCLGDQPLPRVRVPAGAVVEAKQLVVYGLCAGCARPPASEATKGSAS